MAKHAIAHLLLGIIAASCLVAHPAAAADEPTGDLPERIAELEHKRLEMVKLLALTLDGLGQPEKAIPLLSKAYRLDPTDEVLARRLVDLLQRGERWTEMIPIFERLLDDHPDHRQRYLPRLARCYFKTGQEQRALEVLDEYRREYADVERTYVRIAEALGDNGHLAEARVLLEKAAADRFKDNHVILTQLGTVYAKLDENEKAIKTYEAALKLVGSGSERQAINNALIAVCEKTGSLDVIAERVLVLLQQNAPDIYHDNSAYWMLYALGKSGDDRYSEMLLPLLDHPEPRIATLVVKGLGGGREGGYVPPLLLKALESERPEVVQQAIGCSTSCWDKKRGPEVHRLLRTIFEGRNEALKFHACFPLMHDYRDKEAVSYLLTQTQSEDRKRARRAIGWIGDACNSSTPVYPELLEKLEPHLTSDDDKLRRAAVYALGTYQGEAVIRHLIAALADAQHAVAQGARGGLVHKQRDLDTVTRLVNEALEHETRDGVKQRLREILYDIEQKKKQMTDRQ
jgi:tetratricopeptide (TPR) repeat protein